MELIHPTAFDSLTERLPGGTGGTLRRVTPRTLHQGLSAPSYEAAPVIVSLLSRATSLPAIHWHWCNQSHLTWNWWTRNGLSALAFVIHFVSRTCLWFKIYDFLQSGIVSKNSMWCTNKLFSLLNRLHEKHIFSICIWLGICNCFSWICTAAHFATLLWPPERINVVRWAAGEGHLEVEAIVTCGCPPA